MVRVEVRVGLTARATADRVEGQKLEQLLLRGLALLLLRREARRPDQLRRDRGVAAVLHLVAASEVIE